MIKSNQYSIFSSGDSIPQNRKRECANEAQTLVVWAFSNVIQNWMRNRNTVEFLVVWEELHNPDFDRVQFEAVRSETGLNRFVMTPTKWIEQTNAIRIVSKAGRYGGGTYAHSDIAMAFATWIFPEFQLYIMKDYRRLKQDENSRFSLDWNLNRALSKVNYRIHTDAVKENLIPPELTPEQIAYTYASEADLLNVALFGQTAKQWKNNNPGKKGNVRDDAKVRKRWSILCACI